MNIRRDIWQTRNPLADLAEGLRSYIVILHCPETDVEDIVEVEAYSWDEAHSRAYETRNVPASWNVLEVALA